MKHFENLNKKEFLLTSQKMGQLVGGEQVVVTTNGGTWVISGTGESITCSTDTFTYANETEYRHGYVEKIHWGSASDPVTNITNK